MAGDSKTGGTTPARKRAVPKAAPVVPAATADAPRRRLLPSLPGVEATSNTLRTVLLNISFLIAFVLLLPALATQLWRNQVVIEPIAVPPALAAMGVTPDVAANRIWDGLKDLTDAAQTAKTTIVAVPQGRSLDFSLAENGVTLEAALSQLRQFLNLYETRIGGEFVCATPACEPEHMRLRLRILRGASSIVDLPEIGSTASRDYFRRAAEGIFTELDPFVPVAALARTEPERALVLARKLVRARHPDAEWAYNLIGEIEMQRGRHDDALAAFDSALGISPNLSVAQVNRALALAHLGRFDEADAALALAQRTAPDTIGVAKGRASIAYMRGDKAAAVQNFLAAARLEPNEPRHLVLAGQTEFELKDFAGGEAHLKEALAVAPGDPDALAALGNYYYGTYGTPPQREQAATMYGNWANFDPQNAQAWFSLGNAQMALGRHAEALESYDTAMARGETGDRLKVVRAGALMGLALAGTRPVGDAIAGFEAVKGMEPPVPTVFLSLGKLYAMDERTADAVAAYRRFLEIAPADSDQRGFVQAELAQLAP